MSKHIPTRCCMGCNKCYAKSNFIRIVRVKNREIKLDNTHKSQGRGAYLCKDLDCLKKVQKSRRFNRVFKCQIQDEIYAQIKEILSDER